MLIVSEYSSAVRSTSWAPTAAKWLTRAARYSLPISSTFPTFSRLQGLGGIVPVFGEKVATFVSEKVEGFITNVESGGDNNPKAGYIAAVWAMLVLSLVAFFIKSTLEAAAQDTVLELDDA